MLAAVSNRYTKTPEDTVAAALKGGTDLNCGSFYQKNGQVSVCIIIIIVCQREEGSHNEHMTLYVAKAAYDKKTITDDDLNQALGRLFAYR